MKMLAFALIALLTGCCSYEYCNQGGRHMVLAENNGWKILGLAIASGDPEYPNQEVPLWFCDSLTVEVNQMLLDAAAKKYGARGFKNVSTRLDTERVFLFLFKRHIFSSSAELVF